MWSSLHVVVLCLVASLSGCCFSGMPCDPYSTPSRCEGNVLHACAGGFPEGRYHLIDTMMTFDCASATCYDDGAGQAACVQPPATPCTEGQPPLGCDGTSARIECGSIGFEPERWFYQSAPCSGGNECMDGPTHPVCARSGRPPEACEGNGARCNGSDMEFCFEGVWAFGITCDPGTHCEMTSATEAGCD